MRLPLPCININLRTITIYKFIKKQYSKIVSYCYDDFRNNEKGFALMETVLLCIIVVAMASAAHVARTAERAGQAAAAQTGAVFLAQLQTAALTEKAKNGELTEGTLPWQGDINDLNLNGIAYTAQTKVAAINNARYATVTVKYTLNGKEYAEEFERIFP